MGFFFGISAVEDRLLKAGGSSLGCLVTKIAPYNTL